MRALAAVLAAVALAAPLSAGALARITIVNLNAPGVGFNDPTPVAPLPTNPGTTVGEQRLIAFQYAAELWGRQLDSLAEIRVQAAFVPRACTPTAGVLGSAGPIQVFADFPGARFPGTWYHVALASKLARQDLAPGDPGTEADDIQALFNSELGTEACLTGLSWYYGRDTLQAPNQVNLVVVLLHELAHGLGFSSFTSVTSGRMLGFVDDAGQVVRLPSVYDKFYYDLTTGKFREQMTDAERVASAVNARNVAWVGADVTAGVPRVLQAGTPLLTVLSPGAVAGAYQVGTASFGPPLTAAGVTGRVVAGTDAADAAGPSTSDGCSPFTNAAEVAGNIALVDRGTCAFVVKAFNAQAAGATALVVADNQPGRPPAGLGGADPSITIPAVRITRDDGARLKAELPNGVVATLGLDLRVRAGASPQGFALLNAPDPVQPGSSISHWDPIATPNQLMEPAINPDLGFSVEEPQDLTMDLFRDVGWHEGRGRKKN
jgi:hypothetical protein